MNNWRYYMTCEGPLWRINNDKTGMYFLSDGEDSAKWLVEILNSGGTYVWDDGIALTDDGDLVKVRS